MKNAIAIAFHKEKAMIHVARLGDLTFEVRFDDKIRQSLRDVCGWGTEEDTIQRILADIVLGPAPFDDWPGELPDDDFEN